MTRRYAMCRSRYRRGHRYSTSAMRGWLPLGVAGG
jgi:hypothetical protein